MEIKQRSRCIQCMEILTQEDICSCCHYEQNQYKPESRFLPVGTVLEERYVLGKVSGAGNFGITYTGWDLLLESRVAVKEFFPVNRVSRKVENGSTSVFIFQEEDYEETLQKYLDEAKRLSKLNQVEGIVSIRDFFYANNTAYIIMEYIEGISIKDYIIENGPLTEKEIRVMMKPVLDALEQVHNIGIIHRDISPDNIMVCHNQKVVLVDFGAARPLNLSQEKSMTVIIKRGYSAPELYRARSEQGPWTDIYAICATFYFMLTGENPDEAIDRILGDELPSLLRLSKVEASVSFKKAVMKGISLRQNERYKSIGELKKDLYKEETKNRKHIIIKGTVLLISIFAFLFVLATVKENQKADENTIAVVVSARPSPTPVQTALPVITTTPSVKKVTTPNLVGKTNKAAKNLLKKNKLKYRIRWREENGVAGIVIAQSKKAGKKCKVGTTITLTVRKEKKIRKPASTSIPKQDYDGIIA